MVTRTKASILESFQKRKLTGNNGNVRYNGMEMNGLLALGDENVVSFSSNKEGGGGGGSRWMVGSSLFLASRLRCFYCCSTVG